MTKARILLVLLFLAIFAPFALPLTPIGVMADNGPVAVAFTGPGSNGFSWVIPDNGDFDQADLGLPKGSISYIAVKPGHTGLLYEQAGFLGREFECKFASSFPEELKGKLSSLKIFSNDDEVSAEAKDQWRQLLSSVQEFKSSQKSSLDAAAFNKALIEIAFNLEQYNNPDKSRLNLWKVFSKDQRETLARSMLGNFKTLGCAVDDWEPDLFAARIEPLLVWRPDLTYWAAGAAILGIDPQTSWSPDMSAYFVGKWRLHGIDNFADLDSENKESLKKEGFKDDGSTADADLFALQVEGGGKCSLTFFAKQHSGNCRIEKNKILLLKPNGAVDTAIAWNSWDKCLRAKVDGIIYVLEKGEGKPQAAAPKKSADSIELSAKDADLSFAPDVLVEPLNPPHNLGGWRTGNMVLFTFNVKKAGPYDISLNYSKNENDGDSEPLYISLWNKARKFPDSSPIQIQLPTTGRGWGNYQEMRTGSLNLPEGEVTIALMSAVNDGAKYVMNLRGLTLIPQQ